MANTDIANENKNTLNAEKSSDEKKSRSFGNKMFDWAVWAPIQWAGVWIFSLMLAHSASKEGGKLAPLQEVGAKKLAPVIDSVIKTKDGIFKNPKSAGTLRGSTGKEWASTATIIGVLSLGGTLFVPLTKLLEDRRQQIASWFDKAFSKKPIDDSLIKEEPKQTWSSMIKGRATALVMAYSVLVAVGIKRMDKVQTSVGNKAAEAFINRFPKDRLPFVKNKTGSWNEANVKNWANLGVLDLFLTAGAASLHFATSRFFAEDKNNPKAPETPARIVKEAVAAVEEQNSGAEILPDSNHSKNLVPKSDSWTAAEMTAKHQEASRGLA